MLVHLFRLSLVSFSSRSSIAPTITDKCGQVGRQAGLWAHTKPCTPNMASAAHLYVAWEKYPNTSDALAHYND